MIVAAALAYFRTRSAPQMPQDLTTHNCINLRMAGSGGLYIWEFEKAGVR